MSRDNQRRGVAAVEFALIAPLFFMLLLGSIELSRGFMVQQVLTNASRVGAREAITLSATQSGVQSEVTSYCSGMGVDNTVVTITPSPSTARAGDEMSVTVSVPYSDITWLPAPQFLAGQTLTATSVMRKEGLD
ncbi:TadE-like protein [Posidoniimonas polymericola]|uniref:TadE-like protein n=1 Tax=Posidoniimonas polymericola TaxID=2528002 RepID=A0A5C5YTP0_9BACT|nr:TadE/TadG family type IV pilus assembly protein [Posidoniimonas polymericola]TWT78160.1 TadE-like protein [Posidoniimonas polymericola]